MPGPDDDFLPPDPAAFGMAQAPDDMPTDSAASRALAGCHDMLMSKAGVVMVGETMDALGRSAILIGVRAARDMARLPRDVEGVPVVMQVIGDVDAQ